METILKISGGLGNQLFQCAAGIYLASGENLILDISNYSNSKYSRNLSLHRYQLPVNVKFERSKRNLLHSKIENLAMRFSCADNLNSITRIIYRTGTLMIVKSQVSKRRAKTFKIAKNIGWDAGIFSDTYRATKIYGYFQSYLFIPFEQKFNLDPELITLDEANYLAQIEKLAEKDLPLVVHIRFGDYVDNSVYAEVSTEYYKQAIKFQMKTGRYGKIWLFSDEPIKAKSHIPEEFTNLLYLEAQSNFDPTITLEAMRYGKGYVLANSTFGWWGAWLSYESDPIVITPIKWFKNWKTPERLIPDKWIRFAND